MPSERLAVYTTVYPGVEPYLRDWYRSVQNQTDVEFDLWIGADSLRQEQVVALLGLDPPATWVVARHGDSPARLRANAMVRMVDAYGAIIFVDSDDVLHPSRVAMARAALHRHSVSGCALRLIDTFGRDLGAVFEPQPGDDIDSLMPRYNVFGMSNTAYRAETLRCCLPVPDDCSLIDWLLATRAWAAGASLWFDHAAHMSYRQHPANIARVLPPFAPADVVGATARVLNHYQCVQDTGWPMPSGPRHALQEARERARDFHRAISTSSTTLQRYVEALNRLAPRFVWWWCVAHPALEELWRN